MSETNSTNSPLYVRLLGPLTSPFPNFDFFFIKPLRQRAANLLNIKRGDRVLDVGCGSGGSFPFLVRAVTSSGEVVGVEISPQSTVSAERRIASNRWGNVKVIEASAQKVRLQGAFDGLLMFAAADVFASDEALVNICPHLKENARIVAFGAKLSGHPFGRMFNPLLKMLFKLSFSTTPGPDYEPCETLGRYVKGLEVEEHFAGLMFLASGSVDAKKR